MASATVPVRLLAGVAAGLAGTFVLQGLLAGSGWWAPKTLPPIRRDPAEFMVEQAESALPAARRAQVPPQGKAAAEKGLQLGYGATFGMLYGLAATSVYPFVVGGFLGELDWGPVWGGYLGLLLGGAAYISIGMLISSYTTDQMTAFFASFFLSLLLFIADKGLIFLGTGRWVAYVEYFCFDYHFKQIARGVPSLTWRIRHAASPRASRRVASAAAAYSHSTKRGRRACCARQ